MPWIQLTLQTEQQQAEYISDLLSELGACAVTLQDAADNPVYEPAPGTTPLWGDIIAIGLFSVETDMVPVLTALNQALTPNTLHSLRLQTLEDQDWTRVWLQYFKPMHFGEKLWICPSNQPIPDPNAVNIILDPGLAFGTGTHPTTALCLTWLASNPLQYKHIIDFGCGSGILAIAALKLGASHVIAIDNDPQALLATQENAARNAIKPEQLLCTDQTQFGDTKVDIIVANILAEPLIQLAPTFQHLLKPNAKLVLSGLLSGQEASVMAAYQDFCQFQPPVYQEGWVRLDGMVTELPNHR